jgi:CxxC motif-containing protein (DUF1111 family)
LRQCAPIAVAVVVIAGACARKQSVDEAPPRPFAADRGTPEEISRNAYGHAVANLTSEHWSDVRAGKALFVTTWVAPGAGTSERAARGPSSKVREGLGPRFNASSCQSCHFRDGRGRPPHEPRLPLPPEGERSGPPRLLRLGLVGADGGLTPEPTYGLQLQDRALPPLVPEGDLDVAVQPIAGRYPDQTPFALEAPLITLRHLLHGPISPEARVSVRLPPSLIGLGLLEAIPDHVILAQADPGDTDGDGISGRPNQTRDPRTGALVLGRFGWKASQPSLWLQNATALREDLGITTPVFPDTPCAAAEAPCAAAPAGSEPELDAGGLEQLTRYTRLLGPPPRRGANDPELVRGQSLFSSAGCAGCHTPRFETGEVVDLPELAWQTIEPYSDLLLHDMGDPLADHRPEGNAGGQEWRTAPLWGLGLLRVVNGDVRLLHDGRARSPEEAILWHGGEAQAARDRFARLPRRDRAALLQFLDAL